MHPVAVRYDVQRARVSGLSPAWVLTHHGVPSRTQQRILYEEIRFNMSDAEFRAQQGVGRPTALSEEHRRLVLAWLHEEPQLQRVHFLRRLTSEHGYRGGKTAFYDFLQQQPRPKPAPVPIVRFEGVPGEFAQHDFGSFVVRYLDGTQEELTFYAGRLKFSRALHVCVAAGETAEELLRGVEEFAKAMGGLPLLNVFDNTKAAVILRAKDPLTGERKVDLHQDLASLLRQVGALAEPTHPYSPQQKGSVENLVGFVKSSFVQPRQFRSRADLERQLGEWLLWVNHERACEATRIIPWVRLAEESAYLKPADFGEDGFGFVRSAVVRPDAFVRFRGRRYSAPDGWIGQVVEVHVYRRKVVLCYQGERIAHRRLGLPGQEGEHQQYSLLPEHRPALFRKPRGAIMLKRQILMDLDPVVHRFFTELVHRRPQSWREKDLPGLWSAFEQLGEAEFVALIRVCVAAETYGSEYAAAWRGDRAAEIVLQAAGGR